MKHQGLATFLWIGALPNPDAATVLSCQLVDIHKLRKGMRRGGYEIVRLCPTIVSHPSRYKDEDHVGYDIAGEKVMRTQDFDDL